MGNLMCCIVGPLPNYGLNFWETAQTATVVVLFSVIWTVPTAASSFGQVYRRLALITFTPEPNVQFEDQPFERSIQARVRVYLYILRTEDHACLVNRYYVQATKRPTLGLVRSILSHHPLLF